MLANLSFKELAEKTASANPVPGGGSAAALSAALAAALAEMVAGLTIGQPGFEAVEPAMQAIADRAAGHRKSLDADIDRDAEAFNDVMQAYRMPKSDEAQLKQRAESIQSALKQAARVPLDVAEKAYAILKFSGTVVASGNPNAVTDGMVSALLARTAVRAALYNVKINLRSIHDPQFVEEFSERAEHLEQDARKLERAILTATDLS